VRRDHERTHRSVSLRLAAVLADEEQQLSAVPDLANDDHVANDNDAVLVVDDIARLLRVGRITVFGLVARYQIPHRRLGKAIRFSRTAVMSWLSTSWQVAREGQ
jgi:excisionase family DNA binding protein